MEDCQFPTTKKVPSVEIKSQNNVADFFILEGLFVMNLYELDKPDTAEQNSSHTASSPGQDADERKILRGNVTLTAHPLRKAN
jgi:hypothetical protein